MIKDLDRYLKEHDQLLNPKGSRVISPPLMPFLFTQDQVAPAINAARAYINIAEYVTQHYEKFAEFLEFEEERDKLFRNAPNLKRNLNLSRVDVFNTADGPRIVEINAENPGGNEDSLVLEELFERHFDFGSKRYTRIERIDPVLRALKASYQDHCKEGGVDPAENPKILILEWQEDIQKIGERFETFMREARARGYEIDLASPDQIEIKKGKAHYQGSPFDIIYKRMAIESFGRVQGNYDLIERIQGSHTALVSPVRASISDTKFMEALVHNVQAEGLFPDELKADLRLSREHIPHTSKLSSPPDRNATKDYLRQGRERLVLKDANALASSAVYLGSDMTPEAWEQVITRAVGNQWVVQERIALPSEPIMFYDRENKRPIEMMMVRDMSPYFWRGEATGFLVRASSDNLTSTKTGAKVTYLPSFEI